MSRPSHIETKTSGNLFSNVLSLFSGTIGAKILSLLSIMLMTRYLGVTQFGVYSLVLNFWALFNTLVDLGTTGLLGRDIAKNDGHPRSTVESALYLRAIGLLIFAPLGYWLGVLMGLSPDLILLTFAGLLVAAEVYYEGYFSAIMRLDLTAKTRMIASVLNIILIGVAIALKLNLFWFAAITLFNPLLKLFADIACTDWSRWSYRSLSDWLVHECRMSAPRLQAILSMLKDSWSLWLIGLLYLILSRVDTFILVTLSPTGSHDLGIYSAAYRFSETLALLINTIAPSLLPLLVQAMANPERMRFITSSVIRVVLSGVLMISLLIFWYAPLIVRGMYGPEFDSAVTCMKILIWSQALVAMNTLCYQTLMVYNVHGKKTVLWACIITVLLNIVLNILWVPTMKAVGSSWATVIAELFALTMMLIFIQRYTPNRLLGDILKMELFCALSCILPVVLGWQWGFLSVLVFAGLMWSFQMMSLPMLRKLAAEKLQSGADS